MATVSKNFRIKSGLIVEGTTGTINGQNILTETGGDQYILNLIGGETLVKSVDPIFNVDSNGLLTLNYSRDNVPGTIMYRDGFGNLAAGQIDLDSKVTAPDYRVGNAGQLHDNNNTLELAGYNSNDVRIYAPNNVHIDSNNGDVVLRPDGRAKIWGNNIATENYADTVSGNAYTNAVSDAQTFANNAYNNATAYADGILTQAHGYTDSAIGTEVGNRNQAIADAISTEVTNRNNAISTALSTAETYTDNAVANVVGLAPAALDTLQELAAAFNNQPDTLTNLITTVGTKQNALTASTGITIDSSNNISVTANTYDAYGAASTAETNAKNYADGLASNYDAAGAASTAETNAKNYADNAISSGNINATPTYKAVNIGYYTELVSGWASTNNGSSFIPLSWNTNAWGTAKLTVHVRSGIHTQASEVLVARDSNNNLHITEYAIVTTNGILADVSVSISGYDTQVIITPTAGHDQTESVVSGSIIAWAD